jgi:toxin-antitoxin system PIN domain toxin
MTSFFLDINVWLALTWRRHPFFDSVQAWFSQVAENDRLLFSRITQLGLLRLLTDAQVMGGSVVVLNDALALYDRWLNDPRVELRAEPRGIEILFRQASAPFAMQPATKAVMDAYLAAFAEAEDATLVTLDKALANTAHFRRTPALLLSQ